MKPLVLDDIAGLEEYAGLRAAYRDAVIAHKRHRRVPVGDKVTLVFEDRETVRFQVQEMLRIERTSRGQDVQHELDVYNELLPRERELTATLFVEITEQQEIRPELDRLIGIDEHVFLVLGAGETARRVHASFDPKQMEEDRISAVQYLRFQLDPAEAEIFADTSQPAAIEIDHPHYAVRSELTGRTRESLVQTCRGEGPSLLVRPPPDAPSETSLPESERVRIRNEGGDFVIEALEPSARLESADPNLSAELWQALQEAARAVVNSGRRAEIHAEAGDDVDGIRVRVRPV
jgi:hypothetical protein